MKKICVFLLAICITFLASAQPVEPTPHETAKSFMRAGDWENAILVLNRALMEDPSQFELRKDLALSYYYKRDYTRAVEQVKLLLDHEDADVPSYQIAGNVYKAIEEVKEAERVYKRGLRKFPDSGPLYSEYGELLWAKQDLNAIREWEKGMEVAPSYAGNYYNAAMFYYYTKDRVWTIIYGEIFVNMEYLTERATLMKKLILSSYKEKLFNDLGNEKESRKKTSPFAAAVLEVYNKQADVVRYGLNLESLIMLRTKFLHDWFSSYSSRYPYKLFDYQQQLLREGMFEAYNQWLFGPVDNLAAYEQWTKTNSEAYNTFANFQRGRVFKMPAGQMY